MIYYQQMHTWVHILKITIIKYTLHALHADRNKLYSFGFYCARYSPCLHSKFSSGVQISVLPDQSLLTPPDNQTYSVPWFPLFPLLRVSWPCYGSLEGPWMFSLSKANSCRLPWLHVVLTWHVFLFHNHYACTAVNVNTSVSICIFSWFWFFTLFSWGGGGVNCNLL